MNVKKIIYLTQAIVLLFTLILTGCTTNSGHFIALTHSAKESVFVIEKKSINNYFNLDGYHMVPTQDYIYSHSFKLKSLNNKENIISAKNRLVNSAAMKNIDYLGPISCKNKKQDEVLCQAQVYRYGGLKSMESQVRKEIIKHKQEINYSFN